MSNITNIQTTMTSTELLEIINTAREDAGESVIRRNDFVARCRDELDGDYYESFVVSNPRGPASEVIAMTRDQCLLVSMRESKTVRRSVLARLKKPDDVAAVIEAPKPAAEDRPISLEAEIAAAARVLSDDRLKALFPLLWQDIADGMQNALRRTLGAPLALPAPDAPKLLDVVEIAKASGIELPQNLRGAAGKYVRARVTAVETERLINGAIRKSSAYADHAAVAAALREYIAGRKA